MDAENRKSPNRIGVYSLHGDRAAQRQLKVCGNGRKNRGSLTSRFPHEKPSKLSKLTCKPGHLWGCISPKAPHPRRNHHTTFDFCFGVLGATRLMASRSWEEGFYLVLFSSPNEFSVLDGFRASSFQSGGKTAGSGLAILGEAEVPPSVVAEGTAH